MHVATLCQLAVHEVIVILKPAALPALCLANPTNHVNGRHRVCFVTCHLGTMNVYALNVRVL